MEADVRLGPKKGLRRQRRKKEDVERKKTGTIERVLEDHEKGKGRENLVEIRTGKGEMGLGENLDQVDPGVGEI